LLKVVPQLLKPNQSFIDKMKIVDYICNMCPYLPKEVIENVENVLLNHMH